MRIAHLTTVDMSLRYLILPQLEAAAELGEAFAISSPGPYVDEIEARGIQHYPIRSSTRGMNLIADLRAMAQLWRAIRDIEPDVLHTHNPKPGVYGRILGRLAGVPIVVNTVHGLYATPDSVWLKRLVVYGLEAVAARFSDAELIQNPEDLDLLARAHITPRRKLRLLGNGVDLERFSPERAGQLRSEARASLGIEASEIAVGMVGRLVAEKGIAELIAAARSLGGAAKVLVAGPGDPTKDDAISADMLESAQTTGIRFLGMREDIDSFYSALDIFVLPSHREGFPRAAMEAAAMGLPLVLTDIRGCRQVVEDEVNGFLVPVQDPEALARALGRLIGDPSLRAVMGSASSVRARASFDERRVVEIVMATYDEIARAKGLAWKLPGDHDAVSIRPARPSDVTAIARLHAEMIATGFLASLGVPFLSLLYRDLVAAATARVLVAESPNGVVGFIAGTSDTRDFYRNFLRRRFLSAAARLVPELIRPASWPRIWETLRYGTVGDQEVGAELLAMAVAPDAQGRGWGRRLVHALLDEAKAMELPEMRVVVGEGNRSAVTLYERCGFNDRRRIEVHRGIESLELIWRS